MLATAITLATALYLAIGVVIVARRTPGYRHMRHTISELGEVGAPMHRAVAFGVFLPVGLAMAVVAFLLHDIAMQAAVLALCIAIGYVVAALFPCDPGSPVSGSARQGVHNLGGAVEYIGGGIALLSLAGSVDATFRAVGMAVLATAVLLTILPSASLRGVVQRMGEACLFGGLAFAAHRAAG